MTKGKPVALSHLPVHDPQFLMFIDDVNANKGFWFLNQWHEFPYGITCDTSDEYHYKDAPNIVKKVEMDNLAIVSAEQHTHIVTAQTFERCLRNIVDRKSVV